MSEKGPIGLSPSSKIINLRSRRKRFARKTVLKMLAVMEAHQTAGTSSNATAPITPEPSATHTQEFLTSGRTGRRNALPDILGEHALISSSDLPSRLQSLSTTDQSTSKSDQAGKS